MTQFLFLTSTLISLSFLGEVDSNEQQSLNLNHVGEVDSNEQQSLNLNHGGSFLGDRRLQASDSYYLMPSGVKECPPGDEITSESECRRAYQQKGWTQTEEPYIGHHGRSDIPPNCSWRGAGHGGTLRLHWNGSNAGGGMRGDLAPFCKKNGETEESKKCYEYVKEGCIIGSNIGDKRINQSKKECKKWCDDTPDCVAIEYGVEYGAPEGEWKYNAEDCRLQNSIEKKNCDGKQYNLDLYVVVSCHTLSCYYWSEDEVSNQINLKDDATQKTNCESHGYQYQGTSGHLVKFGCHCACCKSLEYILEEENVTECRTGYIPLDANAEEECSNLISTEGSAGSLKQSKTLVLEPEFGLSDDGRCKKKSGLDRLVCKIGEEASNTGGTCDPNTYKQSPEDSCQTCECNHTGCYLRSSFRKRREVSDLGEDDFKYYADGINKLEINDYWATYEETHRRDTGLYHGSTTNFLHWHRRFLYDMETELIKQTRNCSIAIPYWAADLEQLGEFGVQVRTDKYFGENVHNTRLGKNCVIGKHFNWSQKTGQSPLYQRNGCITRRWYTQRASSDAVNVIADSLGEKKTYSEWRNQLEKFHNEVHGLVGGHMSDPAVSSYDPIFWSHHANVDRMWDYKQRTKPAWKNLFTNRTLEKFNLAGLNHNSNASPSEVIILNVTHVFDLTQMRVIEEDGEPFWPVKYEIPVQKGAAFNSSRIDRSMINVELMIEIERIEELGKKFAASMASSTNNNNANRENPGTVEPRDSRNWVEKINEEIERIENRYKP